MDTSDETYRDLVEQQQDLIVKISLEGRLLFTNSAYSELLGKTREDLAGSVFMPVSGEKYSDVIATQMTKLFRPPYTCIVEQWLQTPKGMRCISWSIRSILDGNKAPVALVATGRDMTPVKNDQKAMRKRDEELMLLLESGSQMYYTHTPDHRLLYVSPRIRALLRCSRGSKKRAWTDYLTDNPVNAAGLERTLRAVSCGKREPPYRLEMERGDGERIWVEVNEIPVVKNGKTVAIAGSMVDITEKMHVDEGAAEAEILFKGVRPKEPRVSARSPLKAIRSIFARDEGAEEESV
ncbi:MULTISPECIES: PAS domain-containing protein [unclassified Methanoregula]|uniref:PAS domain-containing protein n=1 Tax=unclassified Methanoregula TaxID=2649730 RepID=UPI0009C6F4C0|nr:MULTISPECIES: PAS domain-containing protein [unclassified Methanoregula]OPX64931.1 MAG: aerobic respiration control sensor protein ArcB [Methanoregula sp. PtaB.Bin085]OPY32983.1 MAG: aerobic respiration control sensor protein ArcB [Methanoregula sp. PtaU1.Bin006]